MQRTVCLAAVVANYGESLRTRTSLAAERLSQRLIGLHHHRDQVFRREYRHASETFPALMQVSGLAAAYAFALQRGIAPADLEDTKAKLAREAWREYIADICPVLSNRASPEDIANLSNSTYWQYTREAVAAAGIVKRFAAALWRDLDPTGAPSAPGDVPSEPPSE